MINKYLINDYIHFKKYGKDNADFTELLAPANITLAETVHDVFEKYSKFSDFQELMGSVE